MEVRWGLGVRGMSPPTEGRAPAAQRLRTGATTGIRACTVAATWHQLDALEPRR